MKVASGLDRAFRCASLALILGLLFGPVPSAAQPSSTTPILLVHGFDSNGSSWEPFDISLLAAYPYGQIRIERHSLGGLDRIDDQAFVLSQYFSAQEPQTIAVAHSVGGLVARATDRRTNGGLNGIITVGSPHQGAPIAQGLLQKSGSFAASLANILYPADLYFNGYGDAVAWPEFYVAGSLFVTGIAFVAKLDSWHGSGAMEDVDPINLFVQTINSASNQAREAGSMGNRRFSLVSESPSIGQLCQIMLPDNWESCLAATQELASVYLSSHLYFGSYVNPNDPWEFQKRVSSYYWLLGAVELLNLQGMWCGFIGAEFVSVTSCLADALIPSSKQVWPGANNIPLPQGEIHSQETRSPIVHGRILELLRTEGFGLDTAWTPPTAPPPGPVSVTIVGPSAVRPTVGCYWIANATGGTGAYTYAWTVNGDSVGTGSGTLQYSNPGGSYFTVAVSVSSGSATPATASSTVTVTIDAPTCEIY